MKNSVLFALGTIILVGCVVLAAQPAAAEAPWHVGSAITHSSAKTSTAVEAPTGAQKYLHVNVNFTCAPSERKQHNFRVTNGRGDTKGEMFGFKDNLLIFEGNWQPGLTGLYLDANGHREPLFGTRVVESTAVRTQIRPRVVAPTIRQPSYVPRTVIAPDRRVVYDRNRVVVDRPDVVHVDRGVRYVDDRVVVHDGRDVIHVGGPDVIHVGGGRDKVVIHDGGRDKVIIHDGGGTDVIHVGGGGGGDVTVVGSGSGAGAGAGAGCPAPGSAAAAKGEGCPAPGEGEAAASPGEGEGEGCEAKPGETSPSKCKTCGGSKKCPKCDGKGCASCNKTGACPECGNSSEPPCPSPGDALALGPGAGPGPPPGDCPPGEAASPGDCSPAEAAAAAKGECSPSKCKTCGGSKKCPKCAGKGCASCNKTGACPTCGNSSEPACPPGEAMAKAPGMAPAAGCPPPGPGKAPGPGSPGDCPPGEGMAKGPGGPGGPGKGGPGGPGGPGKGPGPGPGREGFAQQGKTGIGPQPVGPKPRDAAFVLYISTGEPDAGTPGKVYQVNEHSRILGWVNLPSAPTGMALHGDNGLVLALPRDGGKVMRIDDTGKTAVLMEKNKDLVHPIDVAIAGKSNTIIVADNIADVLMATSTGGIKPKVYERFEGQKWTAQDMSVAITNDKHVILGTDGDQGIFRFSGDDSSARSKPLLPGPGGVAADPKSLKWAATQKPNQIYVFEGDMLQRKLRLPPGKSLYRNGLLSFAPCGSLCVAVRDNDKAGGEPWLLMYDDETDEIRSLFPWKKETMTDFVVGPRMLWDRSSPNTYKSVY